MRERSLLDFMPVVQGADWAVHVDWINNFITYVSVFCTIAIVGVMIYFTIKYRKKSEDQKSSYITHSSTFEAIWTTIPTIVCIFVGFYGFKIYHEMRTVPSNAIEVNVTGQKWSWTYKYPNGKTADRDLVVPVGQPVKLILKSKDVNHSFFLPAMRVKEDVIASEYHYLWFNPNQTGESHIFCTEYCGDSHSQMIGTLKVVSKEQYEDFVNDRKVEELSPVDLGKKLYANKACATCHSLDGTAGIGPSFKGLFGKDRSCTDGGTYKADENYLRESILYSTKKVVVGHAPVMPAFEGQLKDEEVAGLIAFIKTIN